MSFSSDVKAELCALPLGRQCCVRAELAACLLFGGDAGDEVIVLRAERDAVFKRVCVLLKKALGIAERQTAPEIRAPISLLDELGVSMDGGDAAIDEELFARDCCKRAFLRGAFLMAGTVSDPAKNYRIELFAYNETLAALASEMLGGFGLSPASAVRKNYYVIYLEDHESVCDSLTVMGAQRAMMAIADMQVEKDVANRENRRGNCFAANLDKTYAASARQCAAIDALAADGRLEALPDDLKAVAYARAENPELSLSELARLSGLGRSALNRRLAKLVVLAEA